MQKRLILMAVVIFNLLGCGDGDNDSNDVNSDTEIVNEIDSEARGFSCTRSGSNDIVLIAISEDKNSVVVNPGIDNKLYNRVGTVEETEFVTEQFITYRRPSIPESPDEIKLSTSMVNGMDSGLLLMNAYNYSCREI